MIRQAGETGQLYGSVSSRDIAEALSADGTFVARSQVSLMDRSRPSASTSCRCTACGSGSHRQRQRRPLGRRSPAPVQGRGPDGPLVPSASRRGLLRNWKSAQRRPRQPKPNNPVTNRLQRAGLVPASLFWWRLIAPGAPLAFATATARFPRYQQNPTGDSKRAPRSREGRRFHCCYPPAEG